MFFRGQFKRNIQPVISILIIGLSSYTLNGQILNDTLSLASVRRSVDYIYGGNYDSAESEYSKLMRLYPTNPVPFLLKGMSIYWKFYPLLSKSPERNDFENQMKKCINLAEGPEGVAYNAEYLLANLSARGMLLMFYADNGLSMDVIPLSTSTYQYIRRAFDYTTSYQDFLFFTGLYNYYREAYPDAHPVYKSFSFIFPKGDRKRGLGEIEMAANNAIVLKAQSSSFLTGIFITYENNFSMALRYSKLLYEKYPSNQAFLAEYILNLLLEKKYDEAEILLASYSNLNSNSYFFAQIKIFNGIIQEKKYRNFDRAQIYYESGIDSLVHFGAFGNEYSGLGYFGLSRIYEDKGQSTAQRDCRRKASGLTSFRNISFDK
jgi:hypothetical protein